MIKIFRRLETPATVEVEPKSGYWRLDSQIDWYDKKSGQAQRAYKRCKIIEIAIAASIPLATAFHPLLASVGAAAILIAEGFQQLNQWHSNWIMYRSTCEELRHEKFSYLARAGIYRDIDDDELMRLLAERVEALVSTEHTNWFGNQEKARKRAEARPAPKKDQVNVSKKPAHEAQEMEGADARAV